MQQTIDLFPGTMMDPRASQYTDELNDLFANLKGEFQDASYCLVDFEHHIATCNGSVPTTPQWAMHHNLAIILANCFAERIAMVFSLIYEPHYGSDAHLQTVRTRYRSLRDKYKPVRDSHAHRDERSRGRDQGGIIRGEARHISSLYDDTDLAYSTSSGIVSISLTRDTLAQVAAIIYELASGYRWVLSKTKVDV